MKPEQIMAVLENCTCPLSKVLPSDPASLSNIAGGPGEPSDLKTHSESERMQNVVSRHHYSLRRNKVYSAAHLKSRFEAQAKQNLTLVDPYPGYPFNLNPVFKLPNGQAVNEAESVNVTTKVTVALLACYHAVNALHAAGKPADFSTKAEIGSKELLNWLNQRSQTELDTANTQYRVLLARRKAKNQGGAQTDLNSLAVFKTEDLLWFEKLGVDQLENESVLKTVIVARKLAYQPLQATSPQIQEKKAMDEVAKSSPVAAKPATSIATPILPSGGPKPAVAKAASPQPAATIKNPTPYPDLVYARLLSLGHKL